MNRRERILAILVGAILLGWLGKVGVWAVFVAPTQKVRGDIKSARQDYKDRLAKLRLKSRYIAKYQELAAATLGQSEAVVKSALDARLKALLRESGMNQKVSVRAKPLKRPKSGLIEMPFSVTAEGSLKSATEFLLKLYEQPYRVRVRSLTMTPAGTQDSLVKAQIQLETLILPPCPYPQKAAASQPDPTKGPEKPRYEEARPAYAGIYMSGDQMRSMFEAARPVTRVAARPQETARPQPRDTTPRIPPRTTSRPPTGAGASQFVRSVLVYPDPVSGELIEEVVVEDTRARQEFAVRKGDEMESGTVVLIHPLGVVVRQRAGDYFYPLGEPLSAKIKLEEAQLYPEVIAAVVALNRQ